MILSSFENPGGFTATTHAGVAVFNWVDTGDYTVDVTASGYEAGHAEVSVTGPMESALEVSVVLRPQVSGPTEEKNSAPSAPLLVGKTRKELDLALAALRANNPLEASQHVEYVLKNAPGNPDVHYVAALCDLGLKDEAGARKQLEAAISIFPNHFSARIALGMLLMQQNHVSDAIPQFEVAVAAQPNSWRGHMLLAEAYLQSNADPARAKLEASQAVALAKDKGPSAEVTLALAEMRSGDLNSARARLEQFLHDYPQDASVPRARAALASVESATARSVQ